MSLISEFLIGRRRSRRTIVANQEDHHGVIGQQRDWRSQVDRRSIVDRRTHSRSREANDQHRHLKGKSESQIHLSTAAPHFLSVWSLVKKISSFISQPQAFMTNRKTFFYQSNLALSHLEHEFSPNPLE